MAKGGQTDAGVSGSRMSVALGRQMQVGGDRVLGHGCPLSFLKAAPEAGGHHHLEQEAQPPPGLRGSQCSASLRGSI